MYHQSPRRTQAGLFVSYEQLYPRCGCWYWVGSAKQYLVLLKTQTHATILASTSETVLEQTFSNPSTSGSIEECVYQFPLYDGMSVTSFTCTVGSKTLYGVVNERGEAREKYEAAKAKGQTAGLLEQDIRAADVFRTTLGNIPKGESVKVRIVYVGELKQDAEADGVRLTIPTIIAPRYGEEEQLIRMRQFQHSGSTAAPAASASVDGMNITVDINLANGSLIKVIESPSHPIGVSIVLTKGSATLAQKDATLDKDFVLIVKTKNAAVPKAILERHPTVENSRALMTTLVPRFDLPLTRPEVVFVADRSGSMGQNIPMLVQAMQVFLRSIPTGVKFNICSFGWQRSFLWPKSQSYSRETLDTALRHTQGFSANMGGTETLKALEATIEQRWGDIPLEVVLLTDGDIWNQSDAFQSIQKQVRESKGQIRVFTLGIGKGVSHAFIEGLARAGNGFAQSVQDGERMDNKVVRMLKGALSPHINDYTLEVQFGEDDDFEMIEKVTDGLVVRLKGATDADDPKKDEKKPATISLFDLSSNPNTTPKESASSEPVLPNIPAPSLLQAPAQIPTLFPFTRTTAYVLLSPSTVQRDPVAVILRGTSEHGSLELRIPVTELEQPSTTIHCLAARKAVQDLEEGRGWLHEAKNEDGRLVSEVLPSKFQDLVQREAVRLGETFQIANRWCSFVAVEANSPQEAYQKRKKKENKDDNDDAGTDHDLLLRQAEQIKGASKFGRNKGRLERRFAAPAYAASASAPNSLRKEDSDSGSESDDDMGFGFFDEAPAAPATVAANRGEKSARSLHPYTYAELSHKADRDTWLTRVTELDWHVAYAAHAAPMSAGPTVGGGLFGSSNATKSKGPASGPGTSLFRTSALSIDSAAGPRPFLSASVGMPAPCRAAASRPFAVPAQLGGGRGVATASFGGTRGGRGGRQAEMMALFDSSQRTGTLDYAASSAPASPPWPSAVSYHSYNPYRMRKAADAPATPTSPAGPSAPPTSDGDRVLRIISLQDFDGHWTHSPELAALVGVAIPADAEDAGVTALVACFLEDTMESEKDMWEMVVDKAHAWLAASGADAAALYVQALEMIAKEVGK